MNLTRVRNAAAKCALILGAAGLLAGLAAMFAVPSLFGRTVQLVVTPNAPDIVEVNRAMWSSGEPVARIYGTPIGEPMTILFAEKDRIIVPAEDPALTLYIVDKTKNENPLQVQTVTFLSKYILIGSGILLLAGVLHFLWMRKDSGSRDQDSGPEGPGNGNQ